MDQGHTVMIKIDAVTFAARLKHSRAVAGLTQQQLADAAGVTDKAVSAWENGQTDGILAGNLFSVADALRVDPRWLATGEGEERPSASAIAQDLATLPPDQVEAVRALIRTLKR